MKRYAVLVAVVLCALLEVTLGIDGDCDYYQQLQPNTTYYVYSPKYPSAYNSKKSCRWYVKSSTRIRLTCDIFNLPASRDCEEDRLSISPSGDLQLADAHNYCGTGSFTKVSDGNFMNIVFTAVEGTSGGRFLCSLQATQDVNDNCNCGWKKLTRVVGGMETGVNEYPMMAGIVDLYQRLLFCGGTIISNKHILTAAHCLRGKSTNQLAVLVGEHDISTGKETNATTLHRVSGYEMHPNYNESTQANDVAVVTVSDTIVFNMEVGPACLPFQHAQNSFAGSTVEVLGWGTLEYAGETSNTLQKASLDVETVSKCQQNFNEVTNKQICTYSPGKDACQFDSGGPLLWQDPNSRRLVSVGIVSYGLLCGAETPGVNTRVGAFLEWILSVTRGVNYCRVE